VDIKRMVPIIVDEYIMLIVVTLKASAKISKITEERSKGIFFYLLLYGCSPLFHAASIIVWLFVGLKTKNNINIIIILTTLSILGCKNARPIKHSGIPRLSAKVAACVFVYISGMRINPIILDKIKKAPDVSRINAIICISLIVMINYITFNIIMIPYCCHVKNKQILFDINYCLYYYHLIKLTFKAGYIYVKKHNNTESD
jgi:hypothetical protein